MIEIKNLLKIEEQILGAGLLYGHKAIKIAEKEGRLVFNTPGRDRLWGSIRDLADEETSADQIQLGLLKKGYKFKEISALLNTASSLDALESRVNFLRENTARQEAIQEKEREIEDLRTGVSSPPDRGPKIMTSAEILKQDFPEPEWVIPDILPVGTSI